MKGAPTFPLSNSTKKPPRVREGFCWLVICCLCCPPDRTRGRDRICIGRVRVGAIGDVQHGRRAGVYRRRHSQYSRLRCARSNSLKHSICLADLTPSLSPTFLKLLIALRPISQVSTRTHFFLIQRLKMPSFVILKLLAKRQKACLNHFDQRTPKFHGEAWQAFGTG